MKLTLNYGREVIVLPAAPLLERAKKATKTDLCLLLVLAADARLREDYTAEADRAAAAAGVTRAELDRALSYWQGAGVIEVEGAEENAVSPTEAAKTTAEQPAAPTQPTKKLERESTLPHYTTEQLTALLDARAEAKSLVDAAQQTFGKMFTTMEVNIVVGLLDYLSLEPEYILVLLAWCASKEKRSMRYAEKMAISLWDEGIREAGILNDYLLRRDELEELRGRLRTLFGAQSRTLTAKEKAAFNRWLDEFGYSYEIINRAYEMTVDAIGRASVPYADSILTRWHAAGLTSLEAIDADTAARQKSREGGTTASSFDTDEFLEDALRRSYGN